MNDYDWTGEGKARCRICGVEFITDTPESCHCRCEMGSIYCEWGPTRNGRGELVCSRLGCKNKARQASKQVICRHDPSHPRHGGILPGGPGLFRKVANLSKATVLHVFKGNQTASDEEILRRFSICTGEGLEGKCKFYNGQICTHRTCGCFIRGGEHKFFSKLGWQEQSCPIGKW